MKTKHSILLASIIICAVMTFSGCRTMENIVVLSASKGNNLFMSSTKLQMKDTIIKSLEFDVTVNAELNYIYRNPTVNYTVEVTDYSYNDQNSVSFFFENNGKRYYMENTDVLYKEINGKKNMEVRFTSEIKTDDFNEILSNFMPVSVGVTKKDGKEIVVDSKEVNEKFNDLRVILK